MVSGGKHNRFMSSRTYKLTILRPRGSGMGGGRELLVGGQCSNGVGNRIK